MIRLCGWMPRLSLKRIHRANGRRRLTKALIPAKEDRARSPQAPDLMKCVALFLALLVSPSYGASAVRKVVEFSITRDVGLGNEVCVSGSHPLLGGGDAARAVKLAWTPGNVWRGSIALEAGESLTYRILSRPFGVSTWGNAALKTDLSGDLSLQVPSHENPPWRQKSVFLQSAWSEAYILHRDMKRNGTWSEEPMKRVGVGRSASENLFRADGLAPSGAEMEFVFRNASNAYLNAPAPPSSAASGAAPPVPAPYQSLSPPFNFRTGLDVVFVQDQQIYNYRPPASVSSPRIEARFINSTVADIPGRPVQIYLPRGYGENTTKRYPVVYFHDGQNVFFPGGTFGVWDADRIATYETAQGRMREAIIVAIPNGNSYGSNRLNEYLPDGDTLTNYGAGTTAYDGRAAAYLKFLLDNVAPTLDGNFRTLGGAADTMVAGSSMGGLVSDYIGEVRSDRFGVVGIFSPANWAAPNHVGAREARVWSPTRRYISMGTAESSTGESSSEIYWRGALRAYDSYLLRGHSYGGELKFDGVSGGTHSEAAWSRNLPSFFAFALDPWREAQPLAAEVFPPTVELFDFHPVSQRASLRVSRRFGLESHIEKTSNPAAPSAWTSLELAPALDYWNTEIFEDVEDGRAFWRLKTRGWQ